MNDVTCTLDLKSLKHKSNFKNKKRKAKKISEGFFIILLLLYPIGHWLMFWCYTNVRTFVLPFLEFDFETLEYVFPHTQGLFYNFIEQYNQFKSLSLEGNHLLLFNAFHNTFHSLWINLIILPIAVFIGYALSKHVPGEKFFRVVFFMPNIISIVVMCLAFKFMFEGDESLFIGPAAKIIRSLGIDFTGWDLTRPDQIWTLIYIFCIWNGLSVNVVLISSAFQRIPKDIVEAARLDGVSFTQEFFKIGVPLIMPTITTFLINAVIAVTGFYLQPYLLLGVWGAEGRYATIPWIVFQMSQSLAEDQYIVVATIGIMFSLVMFPLIMFARFLGKKLTPDVEF